MVQNPNNPQSLNRYSYVINNPLKYTDPTGHYWYEGGGEPIWVDDEPGEGDEGEGGNGGTGTGGPSLPIAPPTPIVPHEPKPSLPNIPMPPGSPGTSTPDATPPPGPQLHPWETGAQTNWGLVGVGVAFIVAGESWGNAGVILTVALPPVGVVLDIIAGAHIYYGLVCISKGLEGGEGLPTWRDIWP